MSCAEAREIESKIRSMPEDETKKFEGIWDTLIFASK